MLWEQNIYSIGRTSVSRAKFWQRDPSAYLPFNQFDERNGLAGDTLAAPNEAQFVGCSRFNADSGDLQAQAFGQMGPHRLDVWSHAGALRDDCSIDIADPPAILT